MRLEATPLTKQELISIKMQQFKKTYLKVRISIINFHVGFEIALIKADQVVFNSQKAAMLTFNIVSE